MPEPTTNKRQEEEKKSSAGLIVALIILLLLAGAAGGYYYWYTNNQNAAPATQQPTTEDQNLPPVNPGTPTTNEPTSTGTDLPAAPTSTVTTSVNPYAGWKTYTYRSPGTGNGFTIQYPPDYTVGLERSKDEAYLSIYDGTAGIGSVMEIRFDDDGTVRFSPGGTSADWPYFDMVVQSYAKLSK